MGTNRRVLILADSDNTFLAAQSFNRRLDWQKIRDYLADPKEGRELIEMVIYVGLPPARERFERTTKNQRKIYLLGKKQWVFSRFKKKAKPKATNTKPTLILLWQWMPLK